MPESGNHIDMKARAELYFTQLQDEICARLERFEAKQRFRQDNWSHETEGGGRTRILEHGNVFEKAGVNFSAITAVLQKTLAERLGVAPQKVFATGISIVVHPESPMVPVVHMNLRYLELENGDAWFGGGMDLTPCYCYEEDARYFHRSLKQVCDRYDPACYAQFKKWCDDYFFVRHRNEARGIGGIFFDYRRERPAAMFTFVRELGSAFLSAYVPIAEQRMKEPWGSPEKEWQLIRRGRYVEFNLVYDRGTIFGLETQGRTESILMSLPPVAEWRYNHTPEQGSREHALLQILQHPRAWI